MVHSDTIPYPWQQSYWQAFLTSLERSRLAHAVLITGQAGIGKWHYAQAMAQYLLCLSPRSGLSCGRCRSCQLNAAATHPDKYVVVPEEPSQLIKVAQIRQLLAFTQATAQQGGRKVVLIGPLERLNTHAANALLKSLEEPQRETYFVATAHTLSHVKATIRSRCHLVRMHTPSRSVALHWLQELGASDAGAMLDLVSGSPLQAKALLADASWAQLEQFFEGLFVAQQAASVDLTQVTPWLDIELSRLVDWWWLLLQRVVVARYQPDLAAAVASKWAALPAMVQLNDRLKACQPQHLFDFMDALVRLKQPLAQGVPLNKQLVLEELLLNWCAILTNKAVVVS